MVTGHARFKRFAVACRTAAGPDFDRHMRRGLRLAGDDLGQAVVTTSEIYMPSGYEALFRARVLAKTEVSHTALTAEVHVYAKGKTGRRDVLRLERGELRHPVWRRFRELSAGGRFAKKKENIRGAVYVNPWRVTRIRHGFFSEPIGFAAPRAFKRLDAALGDVLDEIVRLG